MPQITALVISNHSYSFVTSQGLYLPRLDVSYCKWQFALMDRGFFSVDLFLTLSTKASSCMTVSPLVLILFEHLAPMVVCRPYWRSRLTQEYHTITTSVNQWECLVQKAFDISLPVSLFQRVTIHCVHVTCINRLLKHQYSSKRLPCNTSPPIWCNTMELPCPDPTLSRGKGSGDYMYWASPWLCQVSNVDFWISELLGLCDESTFSLASVNACMMFCFFIG